MKTAIYFDFDHTLYFNDKGVILPQTIKLIETLSKREDIILGIATGRSLSKLHDMKAYLHLFDHLVLINGSMLYIKETLVGDEPIKEEDIEEILSLIKDKNINLGMVNDHSDAIMFHDQRVIDAVNSLRIVHPIVDPDFYKNEKVYQLWIFADNDDEIQQLSQSLTKFHCFPWHQGGADFIYPHVHKASGIEKLRAIDPFDRLITIGDGMNDLLMIEHADIGIAMGNARADIIKEKAQYIAPRIEEDKLYDFFESLGLING